MTMPIAPPLAGVLRAIARHHIATADLFNELALISGGPVVAYCSKQQAQNQDLAAIRGEILAADQIAAPSAAPAAAAPEPAQAPPPETYPETDPSNPDAPDWETIDPESPLSREDQQAIFDQIKALPAAHLAKFVADFKAEYGATRGRGGRETVQDRITQWKHAQWFNAWVLANGEGA